MVEVLVVEMVGVWTVVVVVVVIVAGEGLAVDEEIGVGVGVVVEVGWGSGRVVVVSDGMTDGFWTDSWGGKDSDMNRMDWRTCFGNNQV